MRPASLANSAKSDHVTEISEVFNGIQYEMSELSFIISLPIFFFIIPERYPDAETLVPSNVWSEDQINRLKRRQQRLAAYRSIIFWTFPEIRKKERRPLPSCIYMMVRACYFDTDSDEEFANHDFSIYIPETIN